MRRAPLTAVLLCMVSAAAGCGDPPRVVVRDTVTLFNEVADVLLEVTDEDSAQDVLTHKIEPLKKKCEKVRKRQEEFPKFDKEQKDELREALNQIKGESKAMGKRLKGELQRIDAIRKRTRGQTKSLAEVGKVADEFKPYASRYQEKESGPYGWLADPLKGLEPQKR